LPHSAAPTAPPVLTPHPAPLHAHGRNLLWLGYTFFYDAHQLTWGALYVGNGLRNNDLIFML